jgi:hypothetical protein
LVILSLSRRVHLAIGWRPGKIGMGFPASASNWTITEACRTGRKDCAEAASRETGFACTDKV